MEDIGVKEDAEASRMTWCVAAATASSSVEYELFHLLVRTESAELLLEVKGAA